MKPNYLSVCRSSFCLRCWQNERPYKGNRFIIFGGDSQTFRGRTAKVGGLKGFVPSLFVVQFPYKRNTEGYVYVTRTCLMHNCGIEIGKVQENGDFRFTLLESTEHWITEISANALLTLWKGYTGYTLL